MATAIYKLRSVVFLFIIFFIIICYSHNNEVLGNHYNDEPITIDSRMKTLIYSQNEVFPVILHFGYKTDIEFGKGEVIQMHSVGYKYAWDISFFNSSSIGSIMSIIPLEDNIRTNMTVITNKRKYTFDLQSKPLVDAIDAELTYSIKFFYPDSVDNSMKPEVIIDNYKNNSASSIDNGVPIIFPNNFNYSIKGSSAIKPEKVFDDGINTYFEYQKQPQIIPIILVNGKDSKKIGLSIRKVGKNIIINTISNNFILKWENLPRIIITKEK